MDLTAHRNVLVSMVRPVIIFQESVIVNLAIREESEYLLKSELRKYLDTEFMHVFLFL